MNRKPFFYMALILITSLLPFSSSCTSKVNNQTTTPSAEQVQASDPAVLYLNSCSVCHGPSRTGGPGGPDISPPVLAIQTVASLTMFLSGHQTAASLAPGDIALLANWLKTTGATPVQSGQTAQQAHQNLTYQGGGTCLSCHEKQANDMFGAVHYQWKGQTPFIVNGTDIQGKDAGAFNAFCINILGNWNGCGACHPGLGAKPEAIVSQAQLQNIDCLMCHQQEYKRVRSGAVYVPDTAAMTISMDQAVKSVHLPVRKNCLQCHARSGGADAFKRGDLTLAHGSTTDKTFDAHMATTGANLECRNCHVWENHHAPGRGADLRPSDLPYVPQCIDCHADKKTATGHATAAVNRHTDKVACQTCHIPVYAKDAADTVALERTEIHRTWQHSEFSGVRYEPIFTLANNVLPVYAFWNKNTISYNMNDTAVPSAKTGVYPITTLVGSINDSTSMLYPFKYKTAEQPMTTATQKLIALDTAVFFATGDAQKAIASGLTNMGLPATEPYTWVTTECYLMLNHEVMPASNALTCNQCHKNTAQIDLPGLGYVLKGPQATVCTQCHGQEKLPAFESVHNKHRSQGIDCASCHNFTRPQKAPPGATQVQMPSGPDVPSPLPPPNGEQLYITNCIGCHSNPPPTQWASGRTTAQIVNSINTGPGNMPAYFSILSPTQVADIAMFIQGLSPPLPPPPTSQIYATNCASCHGADRLGTALGPNVSQTALAKYTEVSLVAHIAGHQTGVGLLAEERNALAAYLKNTP